MLKTIIIEHLATYSVLIDKDNTKNKATNSKVIEVKFDIKITKAKNLHRSFKWVFLFLKLD